MNRIKPSQIIFVTGVGRSGTSLLQSMLNAHSQLRALPEIKFFKKYVLPEYINGQQDDNPGFSVQVLREDSGFALTSTVGEKVLEEQRQAAKTSYRRTYEALLTRYLESSGQISRVIDKDPLFINFPDVLEQVFPGARLIQIIRDPRDVILSRKKSGWGQRESLAKHLYETKYGLENSKRLGTLHFKNNFHALKYEDLLTKPVDTLNVLCEFLEVGFEPGMLTYYKSSDTLFDENREIWKKNIKQPILKGNTNKWKKELSDKEVYLTEQFLKHEFEWLKYTPAKPGVSIFAKANLWFLHLGYPLYSKLKRLKRNKRK